MSDKNCKEANREHVISTLLEQVDGTSPNDAKPCAKHHAMAANPFRFYRGSAQLFYYDIYHKHINIPEALTHTLPNTMIMGDCHLSNFGFFTEEGSHSETVIFGPNDFDDACIGSCLWDLIRFGSSLSLSTDFCRGISNGLYESEETLSEDLQPVSEADTKLAISAFFQHYVETCQQLYDGTLKRQHVVKQFAPEMQLFPLWKKAKKRAVGGKHFTRKSALAKAIDWTGEKPTFKALPQKFVPLSTDVYRTVEETFSPYVDDHILDIVQRIGAGTGSVNMERYYLLVGPSDIDTQTTNDMALCHIVEVKKQREAAPLGYFKSLSPINKLNPAHLTVACKRRMQRRPDLVLDDVEWNEQHFLVRSRHHAKIGVSPEDIGFVLGGSPAQGIIDYAQVCGRTLALAHCRTDRRSTRFEEAVINQIPTYLEELVCSSINYADRVKTDWELMVKLVKRAKSPTNK